MEQRSLNARGHYHEEPNRLLATHAAIASSWVSRPHARRERLEMLWLLGGVFPHTYSHSWTPRSFHLYTRTSPTPCILQAWTLDLKHMRAPRASWRCTKHSNRWGKFSLNQGPHMLRARLHDPSNLRNQSSGCDQIEVINDQDKESSRTSVVYPDDTLVSIRAGTRLMSEEASVWSPAARGVNILRCRLECNYPAAMKLLPVVSRTELTFTSSPSRVVSVARSESIPPEEEAYVPARIDPHSLF